MFLTMDKFWEQQLLFFPHLLCKWVNLCATLEESFLKFPNIIFCSDSKKRHASVKKFAILYNRHVLRKVRNGSLVFSEILSSSQTLTFRSTPISLSNFLYYRKNKSVSIYIKTQVTYDLLTIYSSKANWRVFLLNELLFSHKSHDLRSWILLGNLKHALPNV